MNRVYQFHTANFLHTYLCYLQTENAYPACFQQLSSELFCWVVESKLFTAEMVYRRVSFQMQEQIIVKTDFLRFFLWVRKPSHKEKHFLTFIQLLP